MEQDCERHREVGGRHETLQEIHIYTYLFYPKAFKFKMLQPVTGQSKI